MLYSTRTGRTMSFFGLPFLPTAWAHSHGNAHGVWFPVCALGHWPAASINASWQVYDLIMSSFELSTLNTSSFVHASLIVLRHCNQAAEQLLFLWQLALQLAGALDEVWNSETIQDHTSSLNQNWRASLCSCTQSSPSCLLLPITSTLMLLIDQAGMHNQQLFVWFSWISTWSVVLSHTFQGSLLLFHSCLHSGVCFPFRRLNFICPCQYSPIWSYSLLSFSLAT